MLILAARRLRLLKADAAYKRDGYPTIEEVAKLFKPLKLGSKPLVTGNGVVTIILDADTDIARLQPKITKLLNVEPKGGTIGRSRSWTWKTAQNESVHLNEIAHPLDKTAPLAKSLVFKRNARGMI